MSPDVQHHAFEPFYTTKDAGEGSGLGLSMVYGFAKQSEGHVTIYSEVGVGTTVKLYLPRHYGAGEITREKTLAEEMPRAHGETVLVVEDDADLRTLVVVMLESLGYDVLETSTGKGALEILGRSSRVSLLLTDVVLPGGMSGRQIAEEADRRDPGLPILFMSGYSENAIIHQGRLDANVQLLQKPFRKADIAREVRKALDSARP
jgi:CheY-like chemotaxis protein